MGCPTNVAPLNNTQLEGAQKITTYGLQHGFSESQIEFAIKAAFVESTLGLFMQNSEGGTASGMFGYTNAGWEQRHSNLGEKNNTDNQIAAFFQDMAEFTARYNDPNRPEIRASGFTLEEYIYIKHHDGPNFSNFPEAEGDDVWHQFDCFNPDLSVYDSGTVGQAPANGYAYDLFDPVYLASHAHWISNRNYLPETHIDIGPLDLTPPGEDADG